MQYFFFSKSRFSLREQTTTKGNKFNLAQVFFPRRYNWTTGKKVKNDSL